MDNGILRKLLDEGKIVSFCLTPSEMKDKGVYMCEIESKDEEHFIFANTIDELFNKFNRRDIIVSCFSK